MTILGFTFFQLLLLYSALKFIEFILNLVVGVLAYFLGRSRKLK